MASIGWSPKRIEHEISHSHYDDGRSKGYVGHVNPMDFLHATTRDDAHLKTIFDEAGNLNFKKLTKETQSPFLEFENGKIFGHEGRHRMAALAKNGYTKVPVMVKPYWSSGKNLAPVDQVNFEPQFEGRNPVTINNLIPLNKNYKNQIDDMMAEHPEHFQDGGPITAYHGSPHDFDQFDTSKIGTGEGAQAYGHGLYFAESEPIAQHYRDALTKGADNMMIDGERFFNHYTSTDPEKKLKAKLAINMLHGDRDIQQSIDWQKQQTMGKLSSKRLMQEDVPFLMDDLERLKRYKENPPKIEKNPGHMYEVAIHAHPDHLLDWDKGFNDQSEHVRNALKSLGFSYDPSSGSKAHRGTGDTWYVADKFGNKTHSGLSYEEAHKIANRGLTGADIHENLTNKLGAIDWPIDANAETRSQYRKSAAERVSQHLSNHGIHGIKYLDANSRGASDQPTHNYVIFNHNRVNVKRKYEQGGLVRRPYKKGGKVEGAIWHERDIGMGKKPVQPHALLHPDDNLSKVGLITQKFDGKNGTIHWHQPIAAQDDYVQRTIKQRLSDFDINERQGHNSGGRAHYDEGGDVRMGDTPNMARADAERQTSTPETRGETREDNGNGFADSIGRGFSEAANAVGNFIVSPAEAKENPPQLARQFVTPNETVNAAMRSGSQDMAPQGLIRAQGTPQDTAQANAAEAAAEKMDMAFGAPTGVTTNFNTPPLPSGAFEPKRSATGTPAESLLAAIQPPTTSTATPSTPTPSTPTIEQIQAPANDFVKAAQAGIAAMQGQPQHYEPMGNKIEYQNPFQTPAEFQTPTGTYTGSYDQTGVAGTPAQSIAAVQPQAPAPAQPQTTAPATAPTQPMPTAGNVPMPPIPASDLQGPGWMEGLLGLVGLNTQQHLDRLYNNYTNQGLGPTDAYNKSIGDIQDMRKPANGPDRGGQRTRKIQKLMPDGTYQWVDEPFNKGGVAKSSHSLHNTAIVEQALHKISAPLPALDQPLMAAKAGRRY